MKKLILSIAIIGLACSPVFAGEKCCGGGAKAEACESGDKKADADKPKAGGDEKPADKPAEKPAEKAAGE
jgi:hypothetical protein